MMMDRAVQQQTDPNGQILVTHNERQALIQKLAARWPLELSTRIEKQAFDKSNGVKSNYFKLAQVYFQQVQIVLQNRANQQSQSATDNPGFTNPPTNLPQHPSIPMVDQNQHQLNHIQNQAVRFPPVQQPQSRMNNPQQVVLNPMTRLREPQKFNPSLMNNVSYSSSPTTINLTQSYPTQQMNNTNSNDYSSLQSRYPVQPSINSIRPRTITPNNNLQQQQQPSSNNTNDILHQIVVGNTGTMPASSTAINTNNSSAGDQLLQRILLSNNDGGSNKMQGQNRQPALTSMLQGTRPVSATNGSINTVPTSLRSSLSSQQLSPSSSVVVMPPSNQTSAVQIQPSSNITIQQSPLNNSNGPFPVNSQQTVSTNSSTPILNNYSSPINRTLPSAGSGNITNPDDETLNLIKYLRENLNRLQPLCFKFTNEGNTEKVRQVQSIHQQIIQFINNPTYESLSHAKHFRDMLDRIPNRLQQANVQPPPPPAIAPETSNTRNVFNQCSEITMDFLSRDQKERIGVTKRYLEPLSDVINGVPHKIMRLDVDNCLTTKNRSANQSSLLSILNDEINRLPADTFSIERITVSRVMKTNDHDDDYSSKSGIVLRCKLLEKSHPILPPLRLHISTNYPEQPPDVLSLNKTMPPRLEFSEGHPFFDQISTVFVSHLFKLRSQHTVTDVLNIWRQAVLTAL